MPKKKICKNCGRVNQFDAINCVHCHTNIALTPQTDVSRNETRKYFDFTINEFVDNPPFDNPVPQENEEIKHEEIHSDEVKSNENYVKICPICQKHNPADAKECSGCFCGLLSVKPVLEDKQEETPEEKFEEERKVVEEETTISESTVEEKIEEESLEDKYCLYVGLAGENVEDIVFENNICKIGRDYQKCFKNDYHISRIHCFIEKASDGKFYIYESEFAPSMNHTYLRKDAETLEQLIPGQKYQIKNGQVFMLYKKLAVVFKKK